MRFLADAAISPKTVAFLPQIGHEAIHVSTIGMQTAKDRALIQRAAEDGAVILTFDLDFGDILALGVFDRPSVVIFRLSDERADSVNRRLAAVLTERLADLDAGALILVEDTRYRIQPEEPINSITCGERTVHSVFANGSATAGQSAYGPRSFGGRVPGGLEAVHDLARDLAP